MSKGGPEDDLLKRLLLWWSRQMWLVEDRQSKWPWNQTVEFIYWEDKSLFKKPGGLPVMFQSCNMVSCAYVMHIYHIICIVYSIGK